MVYKDFYLVIAFLTLKITMKTHVITVLSLCLSLLVGCQQSVDDLTVNEECPISIEASIGDAGGSRYSGTTPNAATFTEGDEIGLAYKVGSDNATSFVKWTLNESGWTPVDAMNWKNIGDDHTFYAFYPYKTGALLSKVPMPALTDQDGTMPSVAARDFLVATKTQSYSDGATVSFTGDDAFDHVSSLVVLTLKNTANLASATIRSISLTGTNLVTPTTYSFIDNNDTDANEADKVSLDGTAVNEMISDFSDVVMNGDKVFYFVVNSGTVNLSEVILSITYTSVGGGVYTATKQGLNQGNDDEKYERGHFYNYGITITTDKTLLISGYEIDEWVEGGSIDDITINSEKQNQNS
jgi:hypothetical protein